jgi:hypothetical protein
VVIFDLDYLQDLDYLTSESRLLQGGAPISSIMANISSIALGTAKGNFFSYVSVQTLAYSGAFSFQA